jgi:hypothetical protein
LVVVAISSAKAANRRLFFTQSSLHQNPSEKIPKASFSVRAHPVTVRLRRRKKRNTMLLSNLA